MLYRWFVQKHATELGLQGWVRNLPDGMSVEVVAEGQRTQLQALVWLLKRGPLGARVEEVNLQWSPPTGRYSGFRILY